MPSVIGYANLLQQGKLTNAYVSSPQYIKVRRLLDDCLDKDYTVVATADRCLDEFHKLLKVSSLKDTIELITIAITVCNGDSKWKSDLTKEIHSRLVSVIDILMVNAKSY